MGSAESTQRSVAASNSNGTTSAGSSRRENEDDHEMKKEDIIAGALTAGAAIAGVGYGLYRFLSNNKADDQEDNNKDEEGENQKMMLAAPFFISPSVVKDCSWRWPRQGYCSLNSDGSERECEGRLGGVIRDETGETKLMYSAVVERDDIFMLELLAVWKGIECAAMINISKLEIGSDNQQVVDVINKVLRPPSRAVDILDKINKLRSQVEVVEVYHIYREANKMANFLAGRSGPFGITIATPPLERDLCKFAKEDAMGVSHPRY